MIRLIAVAGFTLSVATWAQATTPAPIHRPDGMITQAAAGCGPGRTMVNGVCVARTTIRQTRRAVHRCVRWSGGTCALYQRNATKLATPYPTAKAVIVWSP